MPFLTHLKPALLRRQGAQEMDDKVFFTNKKGDELSFEFF